MKKITDISNAIFGQLAKAIIVENCKQATKYLSEDLVIKATRKGNATEDEGIEHLEIIFTMGEPNFEQLLFIENCKAVGVKLPKKMQLKFKKGNRGNI